MVSSGFKLFDTQIIYQQSYGWKQWVLTNMERKVIKKIPVMLWVSCFLMQILFCLIDVAFVEIHDIKEKKQGE